MTEPGRLSAASVPNAQFTLNVRKILNLPEHYHSLPENSPTLLTVVL